MNRYEAKIGRENHRDHLINVLPLVTFVYGLQCFLIHKLSPEFPLSTFAIYSAIGLIAFVLGLFYYDNNHHVELLFFECP